MRKKSELIHLEHPGIFLEEEFLKPLNISAYRLAKDIGVTPMRRSEILRNLTKYRVKVGKIFWYVGRLLYQASSTV